MKRTTFTALALVLAMILSGCSGLPSGNTSSEKERDKKQAKEQVEDTENEVSVTTESTLSEESQESAEQMPTQGRPADTYQDSLLDKIPLTAMTALGFEEWDVVVNGHSVRFSAAYMYDPADFESDIGFAYYTISIHSEVSPGQVVDVGRVYFDEDFTKYVREEATEDDPVTDIFWTDFKAVAFKGKDKEYALFFVPASWEQNSSTLAITTDDGVLLANMKTDKSSKITLTGDDAGKYLDKDGYCNFFCFSGDSITYLKASEVADGVTYFKEYSVSIENNKVISSETGKTYQTNDKVPEITGITVY